MQVGVGKKRWLQYIDAATKTKVPHTIGDRVMLFDVQDPDSGAIATEAIDRGTIAAREYSSKARAWRYQVYRLPLVPLIAKPTPKKELYDDGRWFKGIEVEGLEEVDPWRTICDGRDAKTLMTGMTDDRRGNNKRKGGKDRRRAEAEMDEP
jgi:hypothetical protein